MHTDTYFGMEKATLVCDNKLIAPLFAHATRVCVSDESLRVICAQGGFAVVRDECLTVTPTC